MIESARLTAIIDAAFARDRWSGALDAICEQTNARGLLLYDIGENRDIEYAARGVNTEYKWIGAHIPEYNKMMNEGGGSDLDAEGSSFMHSMTPFKAIRDDAIWPIDDTFRQRPEVRFTIERLGSYRRFFVNLSDDPLSYSALIAHYPDARHVPPPLSDMNSVEVLTPYLGKALEINRAMHSLRVRYSAVLAALDMIAVPICLVDKRGRVVLKNRQAGDLFSQRDGIWVDPSGHLSCRSPDKLAELRERVRDVAMTAAGDNDERAAEIQLARPSSAEPIYVIVSPLRDADVELERGLEGAFVTIIDGARAIEANVPRVARAYGLTPAEERLLPLLLKGHSSKDAAERLGVGPETVKSQAASILGKTGARNRLALAWRSFQFSPPLL